MFGFGSSRKKSAGKDPSLGLSLDDFLQLHYNGMDRSLTSLDDSLLGIGTSRSRQRTQRRRRGFYDADVPEETFDGDEEEEIQKGNIDDDKQSTRTLSRTPSAPLRTPSTRTPPAPPLRTPSAPSRTPPAPPSRTPSASSRTPSTRTPPAPPSRTPSTRTPPAPPSRTPPAPPSRTRSAPPSRTPSAPSRTPPGDSPTSSPERPKYPDKSFSTGYYFDPYEQEWTRMHSDLEDQLKGVDEDVCNNIAYATGGNNLEHMFSDYNHTGLCSIM